MIKIPYVVITKLPFVQYFQWFLLGFYRLRKQNKIRIRFKIPFPERVLLFINNKYIQYLFSKVFLHYNTTYNLEGYIVHNAHRNYFCIDCADSPYLFDSFLLDKVKIYFKIQCPIYLDEKGFSLTENIKIQYYDHKHVDTSLANTDWGERIKCENLLQNKKKIKPLMSSPRQLSWSASFHALEKSYSHFTKARYKIATKKLMCYFGNAFGPISILGKITNIDFNVEEDVMAAFKNDVHHPNEKRATAAIIIGKMGNEYDARIISMSGSAEKNQILNRELIIPYHDFTNYVSQFQYNLNISGLRLSIPNRFIESFMVGTAIVTDKLSVRWYLPFNKEVVETIEMGYCKESQVDWVGFENDIKSLPVIHKDEILSEFNKKWAPEVVAQYIIDSVVNN